MDFKHPDGRHIPLLLPRRSLLVMSEESRYVWTHGITPRKSDIVPVSHTRGSTEDDSTGASNGKWLTVKIIMRKAHFVVL